MFIEEIQEKEVEVDKKVVGIVEDMSLNLDLDQDLVEEEIRIGIKEIIGIKGINQINIIKKIMIIDKKKEKDIKKIKIKKKNKNKI